ncbi:hypothetical protein EDD85DRAFT_982139 [Armillaria nabsnona]|nr:hypothetical protein EDD85DRAFT_982139 [Armillaria nabsnona]
MSPCPSVLQQVEDLRSDIENLPLELFEEILSFLDIPILHGDDRPPAEFLDDFKERAPVLCLCKVELEFLKEDHSADLLPWCTSADSIKVNGCHIGNTAILPALNVLRVLELANLPFSSVVDYFGLLEILSPAVNELKVQRITFCESESTWVVGRRIEIERLETGSDADLAPLLRDDFPVSLLPLRAASLRKPDVRDLEDLIGKTPLLIDLCVEFDQDESQAGSPVSFPLERLKFQSINTGTAFPTSLLTPLSIRSNNPAPLEELIITFSIRVASNPSVFEDFVAALTQPRFCNLKTLNLRMPAPLFYAAPEFYERFDRWTQQFELEIEAARTGPRINVTAAMVHIGPMENGRGFWFGDKKPEGHDAFALMRVRHVALKTWVQKPNLSLGQISMKMNDNNGSEQEKKKKMRKRKHVGRYLSHG